MKWLLDTNVVSAGVRPRANPAVVTWFAARAPDQLGISILSLAELRDGAATAPSEAKRQDLAHWIDHHVLPSFLNRILPLTEDILREWLRLGRGLAAKRMRGTPDLLLAATARVHDLIVVSRNVRHFVGTGVTLHDPWKNETHRMEGA